MVQSWYEEHYHEMSGSGRWFRGNGINIVAPEEWEKRRWRVLVVRLSTARDTQDSFTHQLLYQIAAECENVFVDCAWLPPPEDAELFDRDRIAWLTGVVTKRAATEFDCIALSNSIVQELINIPLLLKRSGIPLSKHARMADSKMPLVLLGGANAINCGVLLNSDPVVDALFVGEDVAAIQGLLTLCRDEMLGGTTKSDLLAKCAQISGIIIPDEPQTTVKRSPELDRKQLLNTAPVFSGFEGSNVGSLQISEGCPCFCTFCAESWGRKPYRETSLEMCMDAALAMKVSMGLEAITLYSFNFNMHERFKELLSGLYGIVSQVGMKSQRLDGIADDPDLMPLLHAAGKSSITVGIEGISQRLRLRLQKNIDEHQLQAGLKRILSTPLRELKLFFVATGWEEQDDYDEFRKLLLFIGETMRTVGRLPRIIVSMTPLVRFPFTPLERDIAPAAEAVSTIINQCERLTSARRFEFRTASSTNDYLFSQIILRSGTEAVWDALVASVGLTGFGYYRDISDRFMNAFMDALTARGYTQDALLGVANLTKLPVELAVTDTFITATATASNDVASCLGTVYQEGVCAGCGACSDEKQRETITHHRKRLSLKADQLKAVISPWNNCFELNVYCTIPAENRGSTRNEIAAALSRSLMENDPVIARSYAGFSGAVVEKRFATGWIHGKECITLRFQEKARKPIEVLLRDAAFIDKMNGTTGNLCSVQSLKCEASPSTKIALTVQSPWKCSFEGYLQEHALKYTRVKEGDGTIVFQFSKDALKKKIVADLRIKEENGEFFIAVLPDEKFDYTEFILKTIDLPSEKHRFRIATTASFIG